MTDNDHSVMEPIGEHAFLVRLVQDGDVVEIVLHLDLADVAAAYDDWVEQMRTRPMVAPGSGG